MEKLRITLASRLPLYLLIAGLISVNACKNKKKVAEVTDKEATEQSIQEELADDNATSELDQTEAGETKPAKEESEPAVLKSKTLTKSEMLSNSFMNVAKAGDYAAANQSINKTLSMFSGPDAPVLIIVFDDGSTVEYDEPTTIEKYLNYLKDTKNSSTTVEEMVMDDNGKIKELVLRKK